MITIPGLNEKMPALGLISVHYNNPLLSAIVYGKTRAIRRGIWKP